MRKPAHGARRMLSRAGRSLRRTVNSELNQLSYTLQTLRPFGAPEVFQVELTNHCPMACVMCPRTHGMTRPLGYMDKALFRHVVREISTFSSRVFLHHFGDSLLHPDLGAFIRHAGRHDLRTYLSTNPVLLTDRRIRELVDSGLQELVISLDGVTPETSAAVRGRAARNLEDAERKIHALLKYRRERNSRTPHLVMQFVRQQLNRHEAAAWLARWTAVAGLDAVKVKSFVSWSGQDEHINALRIDSDEDAGNIVCDKPWTSMTILWDGRVVPCCFDHDAVQVVGDLRTQSLQDIWTGGPMRSLRSAHRCHNLQDARLCARCVDKEGYPVRRWYYPLNRWLLRQTPLANKDDGVVD